MKSDIEINKECDKKYIIDIAKEIGIEEKIVELERIKHIKIL